MCDLKLSDCCVYCQGANVLTTVSLHTLYPGTEIKFT